MDTWIDQNIACRGDLPNGSEHEVEHIDGVAEVDFEHCIRVNPLFDVNWFGHPTINKIDAKTSKTSARAIVFGAGRTIGRLEDIVIAAG